MQAITRLLAEHGPMTLRDAAREIGMTVRDVSWKMRKAKCSRQVYISGWRRDTDGGRLYLRGIWSAGDKPDAPKPPPLSKAELTRMHWARKAKIVNSVWQLATPVRERRMGAVTT